MSKCYHHYRIDYHLIINQFIFISKPLSFILDAYLRSTAFEQNDNIFDSETKSLTINIAMHHLNISINFKHIKIYLHFDVNI